jgi:hypothetical protein
VNYDGKSMSSLPPVFAASALYDNLLQAALRQFFSRATFETEPIPSLSSDGRLAIEPTGDPSVLSIRWFGTRHILHVPARRPFTVHEVRLARAIGTVLATRYQAIFDPKQMLARGDLFRGAIEDRYIGAFLDSVGYGDPSQTRADLIATAIEVLRVAALSSYENRAISSGVLMLDRARRSGGFGARRRRDLPVFAGAHGHQELLPHLQRARDAVSRQPHGRRARHRRSGPVRCGGRAEGAVPCRLSATRARDGRHQGDLRRAQPDTRDQDLRGGGPDLQLQERPMAPAGRAGEIRDVGGRGRQRRARRAVVPDGDGPLGSAGGRALRRAARAGDRRSANWWRPAISSTTSASGRRTCRRAASCCTWCAGGRRRTWVPAVLAGLARTDGATVMDPSGRLLAVGAILLHTEPPEPHSSLAVEGARTTAAMAAGRFGAVLKVSEDGLITFYDHQERIWDI